MKKHGWCKMIAILLLVVMTLTLVVGCSKTGKNKKTIVGTWKVCGVSSYYDITLVRHHATFTFYKNGTYQSSSGSSGTYTIKGDTMFIDGRSRSIVFSDKDHMEWGFRDGSTINLERVE
jgi:hypothetical protein